MGPPPQPPPPQSPSAATGSKFWSATRIQIPIKQPPAAGSVVQRRGSGSGSDSGTDNDNIDNNAKSTGSVMVGKEAATSGAIKTVNNDSGSSSKTSRNVIDILVSSQPVVDDGRRRPDNNKKKIKPAPATTTTAQPKCTATQIIDPPSPSTLLFKTVRKSLQKQTLNFKINVECTSMCLSPSGHFLWAGFSDGTLRVFDLTGTFGGKRNRNKHQQQKQKQHHDALQETPLPPSSLPSESAADTTSASTAAASGLVNSKDVRWQSYGAVACQIHARGVHTDLQTTVDISPDGRFVFFGVQRGAVELYAVDVSALETAVIETKQRWIDAKIKAMERGEDHTEVQLTDTGNILDYLQVYCHSDAKLKGFGACTKMHFATTTDEADNSDETPSYLLLTGKGIKNIHIWKFSPPTIRGGAKNKKPDLETGVADGEQDEDDDDDDNGTWQLLCDTPTNGTSIILLDFYRTAQGKLLAVSKSDSQKLRLWDLSDEETKSLDDKSRPKRPPYQDVANSQAALGVAGSLCVCGGESMFNQLSIVSLDQAKNEFNHTELALPTVTSSPSKPSDTNVSDNAYASRRFQRRGEMKAIVNVATLRAKDTSHYALLELDDGSLVQYSSGTPKGAQSNDSRLTMATPENTGIPALPADFWHRSLCLANVSGIVVAAASMYNANTSKGRIVIRALEGLSSKKIGKISPKSSPKVKSRSRPTPPKSPLEADSQALRHAMEAPPHSEPRRMINRDEDQRPDSKLATKVIDRVQVSPEQPTMHTPSRHEALSSFSTESEEPISLISTVLKPIRFDKPTPNDGTKHEPINTQTPSFSTQEKKKSETVAPVVVTDKKAKMKPLEKNDREASVSSTDLLSVNSTASPVVVTEKKAKKQKRRQATKTEIASVILAPATATTSSTATTQSSDVNEDMDTAMLLASLSKPSNPSVTPLKTGPKTTLESVTTAFSSISSPKLPKSTQNLSRDDLILEHIHFQYKNLRSFLNNLSAQSLSSIQQRVSHGPLVSLFTDKYSDTFTEQYSNLIREHKASHIILQRRILRAAEATVRILLDGEVTLEEARNELQDTIKVHEEILYDTLRRQEFERSALVARFPREAAANATTEASDVQLEEYPCQLAFQRVHDICSTIKRPVGRPRSMLTTTTVRGT